MSVSNLVTEGASAVSLLLLGDTGITFYPLPDSRITDLFQQRFLAGLANQSRILTSMIDLKMMQD